VSSVSSVAIRDSDMRMMSTLNLPLPARDHRKIYRKIFSPRALPNGRSKRRFG
jgi:hypothetical protein